MEAYIAVDVVFAAVADTDDVNDEGGCGETAPLLHYSLHATADVRQEEQLRALALPMAPMKVTVRLAQY